MHTDVQDFTRRLVQMIVDHPEAVEITAQARGDSVVLTIRVAPGEVGMVIGKHGDLIKSIRLLTTACATRLGQRVHLEIEEPLIGSSHLDPPREGLSSIPPDHDGTG